ncbi:MAG: hypothetical protein H6627_14950 [Calditrichae bacterium]|nr:hypothetical protein [Calditrichia bacterium]
MPARQYAAANSYRYGFNGKEKDNEINGQGNQYDYGFRIYNPRIGRFLSVDPLTGSYPWYTPYQFAGNTPIQAIDLDGLEEAYPRQAQKIPLLQQPNHLVSESSCIGCASRVKEIHHIQQQDALTKLVEEYVAWIIEPGNIGKPVPSKFVRVAHKTVAQQNLNQGGYLGSDEFKIAKARYDTYGQFLPGISDINDGLEFIANIKDGKYKAAAFGALFFLPGGDFLKPLKKLKGAGRLGGNACIDYAKDFMGKYSKKIEEAGGSVKKMEIKMERGWIGAGVGADAKQLSSNGLHQFIEVSDKSGAVKIFDNAHPEGILKNDFLKSIAGDNGKELMDGQKLYEKYAKKIE